VAGVASDRSRRWEELGLSAGAYDRMRRMARAVPYMASLPLDGYVLVLTVVATKVPSSADDESSPYPATAPARPLGAPADRTRRPWSGPNQPQMAYPADRVCPALP
jgi:hypothetical protein